MYTIREAKAVTGVKVMEIKPVGTDGQTVQLMLQQLVENQVTQVSSILNFTMGGHSAFGSNERIRNTWQNFSAANVEKFGLMVGADLPFECKLVEINSLTPNSWIDKETGNPKTSEPKKAGPDGEALTYNGAPIYRTILFSIPGADDAVTGRKWNQDAIIAHTNVVQGSAVRAREEAAKAGAEVGTPEV